MLVKNPFTGGREHIFDHYFSTTAGSIHSEHFCSVAKQAHIRDIHSYQNRMVMSDILWELCNKYAKLK